MRDSWVNRFWWVFLFPPIFVIILWVSVSDGPQAEPEPSAPPDATNVDIGDWFRYRIFHTPQGDVACIFSGYENGDTIDCNW